MITITGTVIHGDNQAGCKLGFPTANLSSRTLRGTVPSPGVYAATVAVGAKTYRAVFVYGVPSTRQPHRRKIEAHLFGFQGRLYGQRMTVTIRKKIRPLRMYPERKRLIAQIWKDVAVTRRYFRTVAARGASGER